jgi:hypothetical protein
MYVPNTAVGQRAALVWRAAFVALVRAVCAVVDARPSVAVVAAAPEDGVERIEQVPSSAPTFTVPIGGRMCFSDRPR